MRIALSRERGAERDVSPLELFFDLVYVFAIGQLSHHLVAHVDLRTGAETAVMALAVFYAWYMVAWGANWLDPDRLPVRVALVGLMFASLLMSAAVDGAFDRAWLFVTGYLLLQVGRCVFLIVALRGRPQGEHFVNDLVWELLSGVPWVAGAIADGEARLVLWGLAVVVAYGGAWSQHWLPGRGRRVDLDHLFHRAALGRAPRSRALGLGALAILAVAAAPLTLIVGIAASRAVLVAVAIADTVEAGAVVTA